MGVKIKDLKTEVPKLQFGMIMMLSRLVPSFRTATYADMLLVDSVMKILDQANKQEQAHTAEVFKKLSIPPGEVVDKTHPQFMEVINNTMNANSSLTRSDLAILTPEQFKVLSEGMQVSYAERKQLESFLVKE